MLCQYHVILAACRLLVSLALVGCLVETYVDRPEASTVAGGQVLVHGLDSLASGHLTVLLVHVVSARARVVTDPDAEVLDLQRVLLVDL